MIQSPLLTQLKKDVSAERHAKARVEDLLHKKIVSVSTLRTARQELDPAIGLRERVWSRVAQRIEHIPADQLLSRICSLLTPPANVRRAVEHTISLRLSPERTVAVSSAGLKWVAAFVIVAMLAQIGPQLLLAPRTVAESAVLLLPTRGDVEVNSNGEWKNIREEIALKPGDIVRTNNGEVSILFNSSGVARLDAHTSVQIHDTGDRLDPAPDVLPTLTLFTGRLWVQGLVPSHLRGLTVATTYGHVTVHGGSVAIEEDDTVQVAVFDRRAVVLHDGQEIRLVSGERTEMWEGNVLLSKKINNNRYEMQWVTQNLSRDAVHRRDIAQLQHKRSVAQAGILPTSKLYPAKRVAEAVDLMLTFSEEGRLEKRLQYAQTRLNEASALLEVDQDEGATLALDEYRAILLSVATSADDATLAQFMLQQSFNEMYADNAAALPDSDSYVIKKAVLEASAALPDTVVGTQEVDGIVLVDALAMLSSAVAEGEVSHVKTAWVEVKPYLAALENEESAMTAEGRKEALAFLSSLQEDLHIYQSEGGEVNPQVLRELASYIPSVEQETIASLSEEEIISIVQAIKDRIFMYHMQRSRVNQLATELKALSGHPDQGRVLRRLHIALPDGPENFPERIRREVKRVQWMNAATL